MTIDAPTAGTLLMVLNHDSVFKSRHWPPKFKAHCRHNDDLTYDITYFATIWRRSLQIVAEYVKWYVKSSLCLQSALNLGGQCHDLKTLSWFNKISSVPAVGASTVTISRLCRDLRPPTVYVSNSFHLKVCNTVKLGHADSTSKPWISRLKRAEAGEESQGRQDLGIQWQ